MYEINSERRHFVRELVELSRLLGEKTSLPQGPLLGDICRWLSDLLAHSEMERVHALHRETWHRMTGICQNSAERMKNRSLKQPIQALRRKIKPYVADMELRRVDDCLRVIGLFPGFAPGRTTLYDGERIPHIDFFHRNLSRIHREWTAESSDHRESHRQAVA